MDTLKITEIFYSIQGESQTVGLPTAFIRLTGCPLRCQYCDTAYAFTGGERLSIDAILQQITKYGTSYVTVTGGEPLSQKNCLTLLSRLCDAHYQVSLETSGALSLEQVDSRVVKVMDLKTPGSGECERNLYENIYHLSRKDQVKFVICHREDYEWAKSALLDHELIHRCNVLFSPSHGALEPALLADWILEDKLPVRFQLQLHKYVWGDEPGR